MDFKLENKKVEEYEKLKYYFLTCKDAINEFSNNYPSQLPGYEKEKINMILKRLFEGEVDFLLNNPEDYFDLYEEE